MRSRPGEKIGSTAMPPHWARMAPEYEPTQADIGNGMVETLETARDTAYDTVDNLMQKFNVPSRYYDFMARMPIGLDKTENSGECMPGNFGIIIGRDSPELYNWDWQDEEEREHTGKKVAGSITHEMMHTVQALVSEDGLPSTIGPLMALNLYQVAQPPESLRQTIYDGWDGVEEGMTEALSMIARKIRRHPMGVDEAAADFEDFCAEHDAPATQVGAHIIRRFSPDDIRWYLTAAQSGDYRNDRFAFIFGRDYFKFLGNMDQLYKYEIGSPERGLKTKDDAEEILKQTLELIDQDYPQ